MKTLNLISISICRGNEVYIFCYDVSEIQLLWDVVEDYAENPELSFDELDAFVVSQMIIEGL